MAPYQKPENILKRADELMQVNQHQTALNILHEMIMSKRARMTPLPVLEGLVLKFVDICVTLGRSKMAREVMYQYKNIAQHVVVGMDFHSDGIIRINRSRHQEIFISS